MVLTQGTHWLALTYKWQTHPSAFNSIAQRDDSAKISGRSAVYMQQEMVAYYDR